MFHRIKTEHFLKTLSIEILCCLATDTPDCLATDTARLSVDAHPGLSVDALPCLSGDRHASFSQIPYRFSAHLYRKLAQGTRFMSFFSSLQLPEPGTETLGSGTDAVSDARHRSHQLPDHAADHALDR